MKKLLAVLVVILMAGVFLLGYWPERQRFELAQAELEECRRQASEAREALARAEAKDRVGRLFGQLLALQDAVVSGNFGEAQELSSAFFDRVRDEREKTTDAAVRPAFDAILMRRDGVTASLARGEVSVLEMLTPIERELRRALGYPLPTLAPKAEAPAEAAP